MEANVLSVLETRWPAKEQSRACVERQMGKVNQGLRVASHDLAEKSWCAGESYTLADIALGCALGYLERRFADFDWRAQHPKLKRHAGKLFNRPPLEATELRDPPVA
jgi:glutathione S-transferase